MKVSKLERFLLEDTPLFQNRQVNLVVEKGPAYSPSKEDNRIYMVDISDGVTWMLGFLLEGYSTVDSLESRSPLATLQDGMTTGIHILSARVCVYRRGNRLCHILYINHCRPIHKGHTTPMSKEVEDMQNRPNIRKWLEKLEQGTEAYFLSKCVQDEFWDVYLQHVEPYLDHLTTAFTTIGQRTTQAHNDDSLSTRQADAPIPSSSLPTSHQLLIPPPSPKAQKLSPLGPHFPPTIAWEDIQQLILDIFDDESNDLFMDGFIPIPHRIWEQMDTTTKENNNTLVNKPLTPQQSPTERPNMMQKPTHVTTKNDWRQLFLDVTGEKTEYDRRKKLNAAKMEWAMTDTKLILD
ncbi:hypothetical protein BCR42DRAFT_454320 [Absidia repens]|uniref:Uncharacterized protein n=1 Tax=Absidia repens TaxID=90262 RepID=A0A1X2I718_9FUNG|nr:hypothetical protein BCR42DRAFT_454320 [Absidia repens]